MPFDSRPDNKDGFSRLRTTPAVELLDAARALIATPDRWCKEAFAMPGLDELPVSALDPRATRFCFAGALHKAIGTSYSWMEVSRDPRLVAIVCTATDLVHRRGHENIAQFNDRTTHAEMMAFFDELRVALQQEEP